MEECNLDIYQRIEADFPHIKQYYHHPILISFSGGPDSVFLYEWAKKCWHKTNIILVYFNHGLRIKESADEAKFTQECALKDGVDCIVKSLPVKRYATEKKMSIEQAGRELRRQELCHIAEERTVSTILMGHHGDDAIESFFLNLSRGARLAGLQSISFETKLSASVHLLRPLLSYYKTDIIHYLDTMKIHYHLDLSNSDRQYRRNRVRHDLVPLLEDLNPQIRPTLTHTMGYFNDLEMYLDEQLKELKDSVSVFPEGLSVPLDLLYKSHSFIAKQFIYWLLSEFYQKNTGFYSVHIEAIYSLISQKVSRGKVSIPTTAYAMVQDKALIVCKESYFEPKHYALSITTIPGSYTIDILNKTIEFSMIENTLEHYLSTSKIAYIDYDKLKNSSLHLRNKRPGDLFNPYGLGGHIKVNKYLNNKRLTPSSKNRVPLLFSGNHLILVIGYQIADNLRVTKNTKIILKIVNK